MAKLFACWTFRDITAMAQQLFGGIGFTLDFDIQLYFRRAKQQQLMWATTEPSRTLWPRRCSTDEERRGLPEGGFHSDTAILQSVAGVKRLNNGQPCACAHLSQRFLCVGNGPLSLLSGLRTA